jgi:hypothetical protein
MKKPSGHFIRLTRNPVLALQSLWAPIRVVRTVKQPNDIVI